MLLVAALLVPAAVVVTNDGAPEIAAQIGRALVERGLEVRIVSEPLSEDCARNPQCADRPRADRIVWIGRGEIEVIGPDGTVVDSALVDKLDTSIDRVAAASRVGVGVPPPVPGDESETPPAPPPTAPTATTTAPAISDNTTSWIIAGALGAVVAVAAVVAFGVFATESPAQQQRDTANCATSCAGDLLDSCVTGLVNGCLNATCDAICSGLDLQAMGQAPRANGAPPMPPPSSTRSRTSPAMRY